MNVYLSSDAEQDLIDGYWFYEYRALSQVFPFSIYYRMEDEQYLTIVAILDQRRSPSKVMRILKTRNSQS